MSTFQDWQAAEWVSRFPNPNNHPYFSVASREWRPASYYETNTRGCIIPDDVIHRNQIDNDVFGVDSKVVQTLNECVLVETAFCKYLKELDTFSTWFRVHPTVYGLIDKVRFELAHADMKRGWKIMGIPGMMDDYFKAYESFMSQVKDIPLNERIIEETDTQLKINSFTFDKIYVQEPSC